MHKQLSILSCIFRQLDSTNSLSKCSSRKYRKDKSMLKKIRPLMSLIASMDNVLCADTETVESLRKNIENLTQGKLFFSDQTLSSDKNELSDTTPRNHSVYDFIVIGAGSAGATIASRLSEVENVKVLLIEAGGKEYSETDIPLMTGALQLSDQINWKYQTESSDKYCLGFTDRKCKWPRGKITGGSSVINYMIAARGNAKHYDEWANEVADDSWLYRNMLKYFKKLENFQVNDVDIDDYYHNKNGPVHITSPPYSTELGEAFIKAGIELGYSQIDYNGAKQAGFTYVQSTIYKGERWSTNSAYLRPVKGRKNLFLTRNSFVRKILIDEKTKCAYGVIFSKANRVIEVRARNDIILSAGAVNSPQILMLSGVGPAQHLRKLNITIIKDAPVGKNLIDHLAYAGLIFKVNDSSSFSSMSLVDPKNPAIEEYITSRNGSLALGSGIEALAFLDVDNPGAMTESSNIELLFGGFDGIKSPLLSQNIGVNGTNLNAMNRDVFNHSSWTIYPMLMKPRSRGWILLRSKNPYDKPLIYPNYLSDPEDLRTAIRGIRMTLGLSKTNAFQKYGSELYQIPLPCQNHEQDSDAYWECALRTYTVTVYHPSGTCKMGLENSTSAVVDSQLNVIGIKGLKVIDASIMPSLPSPHLNIPTIAIAEKLADQIKERYSNIMSSCTTASV